MRSCSVDRIEQNECMVLSKESRRSGLEAHSG